MADVPLLAYLGLEVVPSGDATTLGVSIGTTRTAAERIGFYSDTTPGSEALGMVVGGVTGPTFVSDGAKVDVSDLGNLDATLLQINGTQVVGARITGWAAATGTAARTTFDTASVTLPDLAERVKALIDDLSAHGLIGA